MPNSTPGPWVPRRAVKPDNTGGYDWAIIAPDKAIVAECFEVVDWAENGVDFDTRPVEANALLIASAPDLLEALQKVLPRLSHKFECWSCRPIEEWEEHGSASFENCECEIKTARAAIAKALGEQA